MISTSHQIDSFFKFALDAHQRGDLIKAKHLYEQILSQNIHHFDALHLLGVVAHQMNDPARSIQLINLALKINPNIYVVYNNLGLALQAQSDLTGNLVYLSQSVEVFKKSLKLEKNNPETYFNLANSFSNLQQYKNALDHYNLAIKINPNYAQAFNNRGNIHQELNDYHAALADYEQAINIYPYYDEAYTNKGNILHDFARFDDAMSSYDTAISVNPDNAEAYWNKSLLLLLLGNYEEGLKLYEWRWQRQNSTTPTRQFNAPLWLGDTNLKGKTILIHGEQGLGDSIQFCRYINRVADLGAKVIYEDQKALEGLFKNLDGVSKFVVFGNPLPTFDYHCPLLSLPLAFKETKETIFDPSPYLYADPDKVNYWKSKLDTKIKFHIGICWSSFSLFRYDKKRSMKLAEFANALPIGNIEYICLQKEIKVEDEVTLKARDDIQFIGAELNDFTDTAAVIENLDLIISTCTSVPHLSAAMGKRTIILLSHVADWRWGCAGNSSNFYKNATLIRQDATFNWVGTLNQVSELIRSLLIE